MEHAPLTLSVIGCGLIGQSWAALFLAHGHDVRAWDPDAQARASLPSRLVGPQAQLRSLGKEKRPGRLIVTESLSDAVRDVDFIQENAPENVPVKRALYAEIEANCPSEAIIASSTSAFTWSDLSVGMRIPARFITAHPFNPPHLIPLIELFGIDSEVLARAEDIYRGLGSSPVRLKKDAVGHIANRLASALWREAVNIVAEGIADVSDVDRALVDGPGLRWSVVGAHMCYHLGGGEGGIAHYLQQLGPSQERRWKTLGDPKLTPEVCEKLVAGIAVEARGRSIQEIEADRDARLINALKARSTHV